LARRTLIEHLIKTGYLRAVPPYVFISKIVDALTTSAGVDRVKSSLYEVYFPDPSVIDSQVDHLIDILLNGTRSPRPIGSDPERSSVLHWNRREEIQTWMRRGVAATRRHSLPRGLPNPVY
jgi:hypothetical protein